MYNVHTMKFLKVAEARARFGEILDQAEAGSPVVIERRGVRFRVVVDHSPKAAAPAGFAFVDDAVIDGQWTWEAGKSGVTFKARKKAR
jgi:prevent-host-death family protein